MKVLPTIQASFFCKHSPNQLTNRSATVWILSALLSLVPAIAAAKESGPLRIVTDIAPVHSLVLMVAGDHAQVDFIIKAGQSPHDAYLKPSDARKLQNADLVFHIGAHLAPQFERQTESLVHEGQATSLTDLPNTHRIEDAHSQLDPHSWLDINNARVWLNYVNKTLAQHNPENAAHFQHNYEQAEAQLAALDLSIAQEMSTINTQPFIVQHDAFNYFTSRYELKKLGALSSMSGHETGAAKIKSMFALTSNAACIFAEAGEPTAVIDVINKESQLPIGILDPTGMALQPGSSLYSQLLQAMANSFVECLQSTH